MCIRSCDALLSMLLDLGKCKPCCSCSFDSAAVATFVLAVASDCRSAASAAAGAVSSICASGHRWRATLLRPMATPRSSSTRGFFHLNAYASTCAQYPNEYPNLAFHSSLAVFFSLLSTRFSRCCSTWGSANPVAVVVLGAASAATLVLAVASDCRAAASAAAAAARHACCVCVSFFFVIHNADASSTDIDPHASGRSPQTSRICSGAYVATDVSTEQE